MRIGRKAMASLTRVFNSITATSILKTSSNNSIWPFE